MCVMHAIMQFCWPKEEGMGSIPEFAPTEHSFAVLLHSFLAFLLHVAH